MSSDYEPRDRIEKSMPTGSPGTQLLATRSKTRFVSTYASTRLTVDECSALAKVAGGIVLSGKTGAATAAMLRKTGYKDWLAIDPSVGRSDSKESQGNLFGTDEWFERERAAAPDEYLSPGEFVPVDEVDTLQRVIAEQSAWVQNIGAGRIVLYLDARWLQKERSQQVVDALQRDGDGSTPVAIALGDTGDPLKLTTAVRGYSHLVQQLSDLAVLRCDLGAIAGVAFGASWAAVGTGTSNRHFQPPNKARSSGAPGSCPSALVRDLLTFKMGTTLAALPRNRVPRCELSCCDGEPLSRFDDKSMAALVRRHNTQTVAAITRQVLGRAPSLARKTWTRLCLEALDIRAQLAAETHDPNWDPTDQITQWASLETPA